MWGHYAENYSGFCIGFNAENWFFCKPQDIFEEGHCDLFERDLELIERVFFDIVQPVYYSTLRPQWNPEDALFIEAMLIKSTDWGYEREWRMVRPLSLIHISEPTRPY